MKQKITLFVIFIITIAALASVAHEVKAAFKEKPKSVEFIEVPPPTVYQNLASKQRIQRNQRFNNKKSKWV